MATGISLHLGINSVDPNHYQGWTGPLTGCEFDANDMQRIAASAGFKTTKLLTRRCTRAVLTEELYRATSRLRSGDIFLLTYSGHGGQLPDKSRDETDFLNETLCLYDSEWLDDETYAMLRRLASDVRVILFADACHTGSPMRSRRLTNQHRGMPPHVAVATYLANKTFYDEILSDKSLRLAKSQLRASAITFGACQDHQLAADGKFNGRFTGALKRVWRNGAFDGNYIDLYESIGERMPPTQTPSLQTEGTLSQTFLQQRPFSIEGIRSMATKSSSRQSKSKDDAASAAPSREFAASQIEWGRKGPGEAIPASTGNGGTVSLVDGDYVASRTAPHSLSLFQNNHLEPMSPPDAVNAGLTQADVKLVDPMMLAAYPVEAFRSRDQTFHLWSDLHAGHFMESWAWFEHGKVMMRTVTETVTWFGGFTGGVTAILARDDGGVIPNVDIRASYGVDGRAFGSGRRDETYEWQIPQDVLDQADSIAFVHYWDPKVDWVQELIKWASVIWDIYWQISAARQQGEDVNAGSDVS